MALLSAKNLSILKLLTKQSCFSYKVASCWKLQNKSLIFSVNEQFTRNTSTTSKKGNFIAINEIGYGNIEELQKPLDLTFNDSKTAFQSKTNFELLRGYLVFQLCGINFLLENQKTLLSLSRKLLGKNLFNHLMKNTFYGHFVAGENQDDIGKNVESMRKCSVKAILDYSAEEDLESNHVKKFEDPSQLNIKRHLYEQSEIQCEKNLKIFMDCVDTVANVTQSTGLAAIKITSLVRPALLLKFSSLIDQTGGQNSDLFKWKTLMEKNEEEFGNYMNQIEGANQSEKIIFTSNELGELRNMFLRLDELAKHALAKQCRMFVDAEQTYFQGAIHRITMELMREFNRDQCTVLNTYQNYLKSAFTTLQKDIEQANKEGYRFGAKLVRGAYMEQERERALQMGYEDPINESYDATTAMYEKSFIHCLEAIKKNPGFVNVMVASHNEDTVRFAVSNMEKLEISANDDAVCFGQLYGMCDFITFYLGGNGYSAFKYVPYGPVEEVLPYLSRRMTENGKGVFEKIDKEKRLISTEIKRRFVNLEFV